jgi:hypothetical protein
MILRKPSFMKRLRRPSLPPFSPPEPPIMYGRFKGQKSSELSDNASRSFLRADARYQMKDAPNSAPLRFICPRSPFMLQLN